MNILRKTLFFCWMILCPSICLSQEDCTGVDCPDLQNCIETILDKGSCCPQCTQRGCTCEGYQLYDCILAGFPKGQVPEGESYFVDFGSTECSCPQGGGKIICHFIPCPEIPPNCIDILQPADGCAECGRIGCTHGNRKYDAGHSFQLDHCQVCHCPHEGGKLMCSPIPGCDLRTVEKPKWVTSIGSNSPLGEITSSPDTQQTSHAEPFSKLALGNTLPLYKEDPPSSGPKDHDYTLAEPTSSINQNLAQPLESASPPPAYPESSSATFISHDDRRHEHGQIQNNSNVMKSREDEPIQNMESTTTADNSRVQIPLSTTTTQGVNTEIHRPQEEIGEGTMTHNSDRNRVVQETLKDTTYTPRTNTGGRHSGHHKHIQSGHTRSHGSSHSVNHPRHEKEFVGDGNPLGNGEQGSFSTTQFSPTSRTQIRVKEDSEGPQSQPQNLLYDLSEIPGGTKGTLFFFGLFVCFHSHASELE